MTAAGSRYETQARICEIKGHWIWASILYRRIDEIVKAVECEMIAQAIAENENVKLFIGKPVILLEI